MNGMGARGPAKSTSIGVSLCKASPSTSQLRPSYLGTYRPLNTNDSRRHRNGYRAACSRSRRRYCRSTPTAPEPNVLSEKLFGCDLQGLRKDEKEDRMGTMR